MTGGVLLFVQQASQRTVVAADRDAVHDLRDELLRVARSAARPDCGRISSGACPRCAASASCCC
ncbi:hypothetical protein ACFSUK_25280 [Sphingobium scionense]